MKRILSITLILFCLFGVLLSNNIVADKGKVATSCVFIQTDVMEDYRYDQDVSFKIRSRAYINGIPQPNMIELYIYDQNGQNLLDTITPNPIRVEAGRIVTINIGRCDVGLYRAKLIGQGAGQSGDLLVQWVVSYPPTDYYFSWFDTSNPFNTLPQAKAEFDSLEYYRVTTPVWDENHTRIIDNTSKEVKKPFDIHFYHLDKTGGQVTLKLLNNVTKGSWVFDDIYQGGIYCEIIDIHEWKFTEWWLGSQKASAAPFFSIEKLIVGIIAVVIMILFLKYLFNWQWRKNNERKKSKHSS